MKMGCMVPETDNFYRFLQSETLNLGNATSRSALQSRTGKYRGLQGNPCNENRIPAIRTDFPVMKIVSL